MSVPLDGKRVIIDGHALGTQVGGNATYVSMLLAGLRAAAPELNAAVLASVDSSMLAGFAGIKLRSGSAWLRAPIEAPWLAWKHGAALLHTQYVAPPLPPCPCVVTLHDMVWERFPETLPRLLRLRLRWLVPASLRRAARIFVVSEAMKQEAIRLYGIPPERFTVTPNAVSPEFHPQPPEEVHRIREKYALPAQYVLYMGALHPRKNIGRLARAMARVRRAGLPHALVLTGRPSWMYDGLGKELADSGLGGALQFTGYVPREDLPGILHAADAFAYISLYEGFGIPAAEAMACGVPVLVSRDPALMEVTGAGEANPGALARDALDEEDLAEGLFRLLTSEPLRGELRVSGPARAARYAPTALGEAALKGYADALGIAT